MGLTVSDAADPRCPVESVTVRTAGAERRNYRCNAGCSSQCGGKHDSAKTLKGFGDAGVIEVVENDEAGTYRAVYTVRFAEAMFVLHCFQKKSKHGIETPKADMDIIHARLKAARAWAKELRNG